MKARGDVILKGGRDKDQTFVLALTMGALAQLEIEFGVRSYVDALARFRTGTDENGNTLHPSMSDLSKLIYCMVQWPDGEEMTIDEFRRVRFEMDDIGQAIKDLFPDAEEGEPAKAGSRPSRRRGPNGSS